MFEFRHVETNAYALQQIINITWQQDNGATDELPRWIRCLFSLALSETDIAVQLLDQAVMIAADAKKVCDFTCSR